MTRSHRASSALCAGARAAVAAWVLAAGTLPAAAQPTTVEEIVNRLAPPGGYVTRSLDRGVEVIGAQAVDPTVQTIDVHVNFEFARAEITADASVILDQLGRALADPLLGPYRFQLAGHTDAVGSDEANLALSDARANAVRDYLIAHYGLEPSRLTAIGFGEQRLLLPHDPENGANRRVQITNLGIM